MFRLVFVLTVICAVSSAMLAAVYNITKEPIALAKEQGKRLAAMSVMPGFPEPEKKEIVVGGETNTFFVSKVSGKAVAVAVEGRSKNGYGGLIELMVGMNTEDQKLLNYEVVSAKGETPGLGTKIAGDKFKKPLLERALSSNWIVKKDGGEVDAITAATISSRAALECITDAIAKLDLLRE
jgi:electron transport complex protein RnfG